MTEQDDIVLQCDVGAPSTAATTEATTTAASTESAAASAAEATAPSTGKCRTAATTPGESGSASAHACPTAGRLRSSGPARRHVQAGAATTATARGVAAAVGSLGPIATTLGAIRGARAIASIAARPITRGRAVATTITGTIPNAVSAARPILPRTNHLLPVAATEIHPI
jgi:hypothetical protein